MGSNFSDSLMDAFQWQQFFSNYQDFKRLTLRQSEKRFLANDIRADLLSESPVCNHSRLIWPVDGESDENSMDSSIWSGLPTDLLVKILTFLPVASLLRQRAVCKKLNQVIRSSEFLREHRRERKDANMPWLLLFQAEPCEAVSAYDSSLRKWYRLPLDFLPTQVYGLASAGGLLLCKGEEKGMQSLYICDPISRTWRELPPMLRSRWVPVVGLVMDQNPKEPSSREFVDSFKVIVAGDDILADGYNVQDLTSEAYDSRSNTWQMSGSILDETDLDLGFPHCNGRLYSISHGPYCVVSYNLQTGLLSKVAAPMPVGLMSPSVVECKCRVFLVGGFGQKPSVDSIQIWVLDESGISWKEVVKMPQNIFEQFYDRSTQLSFNSVGRGKFICLMIYGSSGVLQYDMELNIWSWLPCNCHLSDPGHRDWMGIMGPSALFLDPQLPVTEYSVIP